MRKEIEQLPQILLPARDKLLSLFTNLAFSASFHTETPYDDLTEKMNIARLAIDDVLRAREAFLNPSEPLITL
jgi:hypothetical protein